MGKFSNVNSNIKIYAISLVSSKRIQINQRTIGPENAHLKPDLGVLSHNEMTLTLNTHTFIDFISCLHLQSFRSQAAIVSKPSDF